MAVTFIETNTIGIEHEIEGTSKWATDLVPGEGPLAADGRQLLAQSLRTAVDLPLHFVGGAIYNFIYIH